MELFECDDLILLFRYVVECLIRRKQESYYTEKRRGIIEDVIQMQKYEIKINSFEKLVESNQMFLLIMKFDEFNKSRNIFSIYAA